MEFKPENICVVEHLEFPRYDREDLLDTVWC